jgi:GntR family transcriptional regulator / MocR family aminotransferase
MARSKTSADIEVLVELRRDAGLAVHRQLERELRVAIQTGRLGPGSTLPSSRALAADLRVSRGVVVEAYEQLVAEGYLTSRPGGATRVARGAAPAASHVAPAAIPHPGIAFRYGWPDVTQFPRDAWLRSVRRALNAAPSQRLNYLDGRGVPELRQALASYLNRVRGTAADAEQIVVCAGFSQGLILLGQVLRASGRRCFALEDPSDDGPLAIARSVGLEEVPVEADESGIIVDRLAATDADAVLVTAAHQFPLGGVLPPERRSALVDWAVQRDALIVEDDYDAEYRYDRAPIGAIQGLAPERVAYIGSASKTLAPGLRLGWMVLPWGLVDAVAEAKRAADRGSPAIDQLAFADFLTRGEFDHHLRRMRPIYRGRRDTLLAALSRHLPALEPVGASAGLHVVAWLPAGVDEGTLVREAQRFDVGVDPVSRYYIAHRPSRSGLLFGYADLSEPAIEEGVRRLALAFDSAVMRLTHDP